MSMSLNYRKYALLVSQGLAMSLVVGGALRCSSSSGGNVVQQGGSGSSGNTSGSGGSGSSGTGTSGSSTTGTGTSGSSTTGTGTSGSSTSGDVGGGGGTDAGLVLDGGAEGGGCSSPQKIATKVSFSVGWPSSTAGNAGTDTINIWLLATLTGDGTLSGTAQSCGLKLPDLVLNSLGMTATGGGTKIQIQILNSTWDKITRTFAVTGTQTGFTVGSTQTTNPSVALLGLKDTGTYAMDSTAWPPTCTTTGQCASSPLVTCTSGTCTGAHGGSFVGADLTDDDGDGKPGITANPASTNGYVLPPTAALFAASADQVYIVSRNEVAITGMRMTDCAHLSGTAKLTLFDNHVVGCHTAAYTDGLQTMHPAADCSSDEVQFLDTNRTIYGSDQMGTAISKTNPVMGTATSVLLSASAKCSDARGALP
jgi:hypothetical protein